MVELHDDERSLIGASREGNHEAFETLVKRYQKMIHAVTFRMTGSMSDSEDLAQETFIAAFRQLGDFRGDARFSSWLYRIATSLSLNWLKRNQRRERTRENWSRAVESDNAPEASLDDLSQMVQLALLKLHPKQRAAILLTTYEGMNHAEAACVLGCSETTVSWRIFAGRRKLKRILAKTMKGLAS